VGATGPGDLPEVEIIDPDPGVAPTTRVTRGVDGRRGRDLVVLAVVAAVVVIGVVASLSGRGSSEASAPDTSPWSERPPKPTSTTPERPSTTTSRPTTTTTVEVTDVGVLIPGAEEIRAVLSLDHRRPVIVDLGTGAVEGFSRPGGMSSMFGVHGGLVGVRNESAVFVPIDGEPVELGQAWMVLPTTSDEQVWLFHDEFVAPDVAPSSTMVLAGLDGSVLLGPLSIPSHRVVSADTDGIAFTSVGGAYFADADGTRRIPGLAAVDVMTPSYFLGIRCDDEARCGPAAVDRRSGEVSELAELTGADWVDDVSGAGFPSGEYFYEARPVLSPSGEQVAFGRYAVGGPELVVLDLSGSPGARRYPLPDDLDAYRTTWLPGGHGLLLPSHDGVIHHLDLSDGELDPFPRDLSPLDEQLVVLPR
jgi:hypothetical protein